MAEKTERVVVTMPSDMKLRLQQYIVSTPAQKAGHTDMAGVLRMALDDFLKKRGV